jgi:hypothetical protein
VSELLLDDGSAAWVAEPHGAIERAPERGSPALDLTDATGRAHAAAWLTHQQSGALVRRLDRADYDVFLLARDFSAMTPEQIDTLARLVYRAAGRLP